MPIDRAVVIQDNVADAALRSSVMSRLYGDIFTLIFSQFDTAQSVDRAACALGKDDPAAEGCLTGRASRMSSTGSGMS